MRRNLTPKAFSLKQTPDKASQNRRVLGAANQEQTFSQFKEAGQPQSAYVNLLQQETYKETESQHKSEITVSKT